jgi:APA family basic amino acid/polyamine antiporter
MAMPQTRPELVRGLGLLAAISINIANMIGTGVFLKTRVMTCNVGTPALVFAVWIAAGLLALAGAICYSEVAAMMPEAGGDYVFLRRAYGRLTAFLFGWTWFTVARAGAQAALAVGFAIFLNVALGGQLAADLVRLPVGGAMLHLSWMTLVALAAIWTVALVNCRPVATGGRAAIVLTVLKVLLVVAIAASALSFATGSWSHFALPATGGSCAGVEATARGGIAGFGAAMLGALWAYDGWNNVAPLVGEIKDPKRNVPRAFFGGTLAVGALYLIVNAAYFYVLTPTEIASVPTSSSVATEVMQRFVGPQAVTLVAVALMISSFGALHASVLASSRIPFAMAREGLFFRRLAAVSPGTHVPVNAILAQAGWASVLALSGSYDVLTDSVIFVEWLFYGLAAASLFVFRRTQPGAVRPYRAFGYPWVPGVFVLLALLLVVNTFVATPRLALVGAAVMLAGLPFYAWWSKGAAPADRAGGR